MAGWIEVESVLGEGSTFSLVLPRSNRSTATATTRWSCRAPSHDRAVDLLYIEDNPANQSLMARIARLRPSATLRLAPTGTAGVEAAQERTPGLVLLDLHLPTSRATRCCSAAQPARPRPGADRRRHGGRHPGAGRATARPRGRRGDHQTGRRRPRARLIDRAKPPC